MDKEFLLEAHRSVNQLLRKLALGMDRNLLNQRVIDLSEQMFGQRMASILLVDPEAQTLHVEYAPHLPEFYNQKIEGTKIGVGVGSCGEAAVLGARVQEDALHVIVSVWRVCCRCFS